MTWEDDVVTPAGNGCEPSHLDEMPPVANLLARGTMLVLAAVAAGTDHGWPHPGLVGLMLVAVVPWLRASIWEQPLVRAAVFLVPIGTIVVFGHDLGLFDDVNHAQVTLIVLAWFVGEASATTPPRLHVPIAAVAGGIVVAWGVSSDLAPEMFGWLVGLSVALAVGTMLRLVLISNMRLRIAQSQLAEQAVSEERARIAREVHDVVAHSLTVSMLHVTAARMAIDRSPEKAREALEEAERHGRRSLTDIRRVMGVLRTGDGAATSEALPGVDDLQELVEGYRSAGLDVILRGTLIPGTLTAAGELVVYRVVQESLANVVKHAPGAKAVVSCTQHGDEVVLEVVDCGAETPAAVDDGSGTGLVGMRERVTQAGGHLMFGPLAEGWRVEARIPVTRPVFDEPELAGGLPR